MNSTTYAHPLVNVLLQIQYWMQSVATFFDGDKADDNFDGDDAFDDDSFSDDDSDDEDDGEDDDDKDDDEDSDDNKKSKKPLSKAERTAIIQKKRYRDQVKQLKTEIDTLKNKDKSSGLSEEEKKEQAAKQFLADQIKSVLAELQSEQAGKSKEEQEKFEDELEEVLDENENLTEKDIRKTAKDLDVSPRVAARILERERKLTKRSKPDMPKEKRASTTITKGEDTNKSERITLDSVARRLKERLSKGEL